MTQEGALPIPTGTCGKGTKLVNGVCEIEESWVQRNYVGATSLVAIITAGVNLGIIFWMNSDGLNLGLGLASIGIITFIGISVSSSVFEEHRHDHGKKKNQSLVNALVGTGIMRKSIAASLVMTYIVLIGLSFGADTLYDSFMDNKKPPQTDVDVTPTTKTVAPITSEPPNESSKGDVNTNISINLENIGQFLKDNNQIDEVTLKITNSTSNEIQEIILAKEPETLVEHFTIIISVVIGFYFGANAVSAFLKSRKDPPTAQEILQIKLVNSEITEKDYTKNMKLLNKKYD